VGIPSFGNPLYIPNDGTEGVLPHPHGVVMRLPAAVISVLQLKAGAVPAAVRPRRLECWFNEASQRCPKSHRVRPGFLPLRRELHPKLQGVHCRLLESLYAWPSAGRSEARRL